MQIISTAVVLAASLVLGAISLMGLSQGGREQRGYQALSRAAGTGSEEPRNPGGLEDPQQPAETQMPNSPACSINSGRWCFYGTRVSAGIKSALTWRPEKDFFTGKTRVLMNLYPPVFMLLLLADMQSFSPVQNMPDMIASTQRQLTSSTGNSFHSP